jgi:hypothetical protein
MGNVATTTPTDFYLTQPFITFLQQDYFLSRAMRNISRTEKTGGTAADNHNSFMCALIQG